MRLFWNKNKNKAKTEQDLYRDDVVYNPDPTIDRIVFACGLQRSGTTLLEQYLHAHYDVSVLRANVPENEGQHLQSVFPPAYKYGGPGRFAFAAEMHPEPPTDAQAQQYRQTILNEWKRFVVGDSPVLLEKSPPSLTKIAWLRKVFPNSQFIIITRDPRAVSVATRKWRKQMPLEALMMHWNVAHSIALREIGEDCRILRYEDFCEDPAGTLARAGVDDILDKRPEVLGIEERFENIVNTNEKYIAQHTCPFYGEGAWRRFGYDI